MGKIESHRSGATLLAEMQAFAGFAKGTQRYIRRSLDIGLGRRDAVLRWARSEQEQGEIQAQQKVYRRLDLVRDLVPDDSDIELMSALMHPLVEISAFDLAQGRLLCFAGYQFLYERLIGAAVRPWLLPAFCAAATLPHLHPEDRRRLLASVGAADATAFGWSNREPTFFPEWVEKVDTTIEV